MSAVKMPGPVRMNRLASTELIAKAGDDSAVHHLAEKAKLRTLRVVPEGELRQFLDGLNTHNKAQGLARLDSSHHSNCARATKCTI